MKFLKKIRREQGYAMITMTMLTIIVSLSIISALTFFTLQEVKTNRAYIQSVESHYISEGGIEDAVYRILTGKQIGASEVLNVGSGATTVTVTTSGNKRTIRSEGLRNTYQRNLETIVDITTTGIAFNYGVQVGDGGLEMMNSSTISGSVYSNGTITGNTGATITGDAFVAVPTPPVINQSWEIQNADFKVGTAQGAIITTVDSTGIVGTYNSLALGSDDFGRISYIDDTNNGLKFAQCTNDTCSSSLRATLDTASDINEVTSLVLGSDGFARISYYYDVNDDLKFVQCTNDACTTKNVTTVDATGNMGDFSSVAMGSDGFARIGYWDDSNKDVRYAQCTNAACTTKIITIVESSGMVGEYIALKIGTDGFGRMAYYADTNGDLKFIRCTNNACTTKVITIVDAAGDVGKHASLALDSNGFAFISYFDDTNNDLKFVRCTNADCTTKNITTVSAGGSVGEYTSLAIGSDGFARISHYDASNSALKFARCMNLDCTSATISTVISAGTVGQYTSLALGTDGFGRITFYDASNADLKFVRCTDQNCLQSNTAQVDVTQSFQPTTTDTISQIDLYLKRVGTPANATLRLIKDSGGSPSTNPADVLATGLIAASAVGTSYSWQRISLSSTPTLTLNTNYWIVVDSSLDNINYFVWGFDSTASYTRGSPKRTADWTTGGWISIVGDLNFRAYMGGNVTSLNNVTVGGNANAHSIDMVTTGGNANAFTLSNGIVAGNINANSIADCTIGGNASYNSTSNCVIIGSQTTPTTPPADPPSLPMPISDAQIQQWKNDATVGGVIAGDYSVTTDVNLGPKEITGNLIINTNNKILTITGTMYVHGTIDISNGSSIRCAASYGVNSCLVVTDSSIHLQNNGIFQGSGTSGSYLTLLTTVSGGGHHNSAIDLHNNASGAIFYAGNGMIYLHNNVSALQLTAYKIHLENNATLIYEAGLADINFSSGPSGGYDVQQWKEVD